MPSEIFFRGDGKPRTLPPPSFIELLTKYPNITVINCIAITDVTKSSKIVTYVNEDFVAKLAEWLVHLGHSGKFFQISSDYATVSDYKPHSLEMESISKPAPNHRLYAKSKSNAEQHASIYPRSYCIRLSSLLFYGIPNLYWDLYLYGHVTGCRSKERFIRPTFAPTVAREIIHLAARVDSYFPLLITLGPFAAVSQYTVFEYIMKMYRPDARMRYLESEDLDRRPRFSFASTPTYGPITHWDQHVNDYFKGMFKTQGEKK